MSDSQPERRYSDREVRAILERAAELAAARASSGGEAGMTLAQIEQAAGELGIDPRLMREAAAEVEAGTSPGFLVRLLGGPWSVTSDRVVPGSIADEDWVGLVEDLRAATGRVGHPASVGKGFEWQSNQPDPLHVSITPHGTGTRVRLTSRFGQWAVLFIPAFIFSMMAFAITGAVLADSGLMNAWVLALLACIPLGALAGARALFARMCARKRRLARRLVALVEERFDRAKLDASEHAGLQAAPSPSLPEEAPAVGQVGAQE